ncbi:Hypothetical predicted protein [Olea europaea subsp. europaea]|uniref:Uncharacterized protein n=1 Tax=Olea europaea subsp. europaea TaxID=158383 RepID=A0A8S0TTK5_OLEEU|nr:Hypothetical predicted protein [Olea europaea subsp. europaea]
MTLEPGNFFEYVQILFKFKINEEGKLIIIAEGVKEENIDIVLRLSWNIGFLLRRNIIWSRRKYVLFADSLEIEAKDSLKKRKEEIPQTYHSVKHVEVNPSKRKTLPLIRHWMDPNMIHLRSKCQIKVKRNISREREMVQISISPPPPPSPLPLPSAAYRGRGI